MTIVKVNTSHAYDVLIGKDILDDCGKYIADILSPCKLCIVTDDNVAPLYLERTERSLRQAGFETVSFVFPHGECSKNLSTLGNILEFAAEHRLTRSDAFVALGGGVVGDMCGFASSIYLRGTKFIQIPTTLLAAVDSSVGGKTGVDLEAGKNLVGAFHQPSLVICDYSTLDTLTDSIFSDGCAEVIKYGIINDKEFFDSLEKVSIKAQIEQVIARCVQNKSRIVTADEFDNGERQLLNLGHTVGHAIELCSCLEISHGSAVAIGTVIVTRAAVSLGLCHTKELERITALLAREGLPTECPFTAEELCTVATADKKRKGGHITLVVPHAIGDTRLCKTDISELQDFISKGL